MDAGAGRGRLRRDRRRPARISPGSPCVEHGLKTSPSPTILRRARVLAVSAEVAEIELLEGPLAGETVAGVYFQHLGDPPAAGEEVAANTVGLEMGLGTGGVAVLLPSQDGSTRAPINENHFVKLP